MVHNLCWERPISDLNVFASLFLLSAIFPGRFCFASGAPDNVKVWKFPDGNFMQNFSGHQAIVNTVAINSDNVLVSGGGLSFTETGRHPNLPFFRFFKFSNVVEVTELFHLLSLALIEVQALRLELQ